MSSIQAVLFKRKYYNSSEARKYLKLKKYKPIKRVDKTTNFLRYRINNPEKYRSFITRKINKGKIHLIIGYK